MADGQWVFGDATMAVELYSDFNMPKIEIALDPVQLKEIADGNCVVIFDGKQILFISGSGQQ